jgi:hypothetical protein
MRPKIYDETLQLKLPPVLNAGLEHVAEKQHTTKSEIVRRLIPTHYGATQRKLSFRAPPRVSTPPNPKPNKGSAPSNQRREQGKRRRQAQLPGLAGVSEAHPSCLWVG